MAGCEGGSCGLQLRIPSESQRPLLKVYSAPTFESQTNEKTLKGKYFYPKLDIFLAAASGVPIEGHVVVKTGMGFLSYAEGDAVVSDVNTINGILSFGKFSAPVRRGIVTITITNPMCLRGYRMLDKTVRFVHWGAEERIIRWDKRETSTQLA